MICFRFVGIRNGGPRVLSSVVAFKMHVLINHVAKNEQKVKGVIDNKYMFVGYLI